MKVFSILLVAAPLAFGDTNPPEKMRGASLPKQRKPDIVIGVNSIAGGVAEPGWPIIVSAAMDDDKPVPANLNVRMTDEHDNEIAIAFEAVRGFWIADEAATSSLRPGTYRVTLIPAGELKVESGDLFVGPSDATALVVLKIQRALLTDKEDEALAEADRHPESVDALIAKGDILMARDDPDEAVKAYESALKLHDPEDGEPFPLLMRRRAAFVRSLEKRGVIPDQSTP